MTKLISGEKVFIRAFEEGDLDFLQALINDKEVNDFAIMTIFPMSQQGARKFWERSGGRILTVCLKGNTDENNRLGFVVLQKEISEYRSIEFGILLAKDFWGNGYGIDATRIMVRFLFFEANFVRVGAYVVENNTRSVKMMEKAGFKKEGLLQSCYFQNGEYRNAYLYAMVRS